MDASIRGKEERRLGDLKHATCSPSRISSVQHVLNMDVIISVTGRITGKPSRD